MRVLSVDPGETTGWAIWENGNPIKVGESKLDTIQAFICDPETQVDVYVVEDYIIFPPNLRDPKSLRKFMHMWDKGITLRIIGAFTQHAFENKKGFILQMPAEKPLAYKHLGGEYKKGKKKMHIYDALAHGKLYHVKRANAETKRDSGQSLTPTEQRVLSSYPVS